MISYFSLNREKTISYIFQTFSTGLFNGPLSSKNTILPPIKYSIHPIYFPADFYILKRTGEASICEATSCRINENRRLWVDDDKVQTLAEKEAGR